MLTHHTSKVYSEEEFCAPIWLLPGLLQKKQFNKKQGGENFQGLGNCNWRLFLNHLKILLQIYPRIFVVDKCDLISYSARFFLKQVSIIA